MFNITGKPCAQKILTLVSNRAPEVVSNVGVAEVDMKVAEEGLVATMEEVEEEDTTTGVAGGEVEEEEEVGVAITHLATRAIAARKLRHSLLNAVSRLDKQSCTDPGLQNGMEPWLLK